MSHMQQMLIGAASTSFQPGFNLSSFGGTDSIYSFYSDGTAAAGLVTQWGAPTTVGAGNNYYIKITGTETALSVGSINWNTWYQLNSTRFFALRDEGASGSGTVSISATAGGTVLASCTFSIGNS